MQHWNEYWQHAGVLNSFAEGKANQGYEGAIKAFWDDCFGELKSTAKILDVGTGNGALALLAVDFASANKKRFKVEGADAAAIEPSKNAKEDIAKSIAKITFHSETPAEKLPHEDGSLDAVISQFGFEYADNDKALAEIARVLNAKGKFTALVHHQDSDLTVSSQHGAEILDQVLHHSPLFPTTDVIIQLSVQALQQLGDQKFQEYSVYRILRNNVMWIIQQMRGQFPQQHHQVFLDDVQRRFEDVFRNIHTGRINQVAEYLRFNFNQLLAHMNRLVDQVKAAMSADDIAALTKLAEKHGLKLEAKALELEEGVKVWALHATK